MRGATSSSSGLRNTSKGNRGGSKLRILATSFGPTWRERDDHDSGSCWFIGFDLNRRDGRCPLSINIYFSQSHGRTFQRAVHFWDNVLRIRVPCGLLLKE